MIPELLIFGLFNLLSLIAGVVFGVLIDKDKSQSLTKEISHRIEEIRNPQKRRVGAFKPLPKEKRRIKGTAQEETEVEMEKVFDSLTGDEQDPV